MPGPERRAAHAPGAAELVADYRRWLAADGRGSACYVNAAWAFLGRWPDPATFAAAPLEQRVALVASQRPLGVPDLCSCQRCVIGLAARNVP